MSLENNVSFLQLQYMQNQMWAMYWCVMAFTGQAAKRKMYKFREPTEDEKIAGHPSIREEMTDEEKTQEVLEVMHQNINSCLSILYAIEDEMEKRAEEIRRQRQKAFWEGP